MTRKRSRAALLLLISLGAILRWQGLRWDSGHHLHPDERFISMVEERLEFPSSLAEYFDSKRSPLDPYNRDHSSFVYGTLPIVLAKVCGGLLGLKGYDGTYLAGRALSGLFDLLTVWIVYLIARRAGGSRRAALLAAGLLSFCVLGIQLSHFWAVDTFLTTFSAATLLGAVRQARGRSSPLGDLATGLALGLAAACKVTALALLLPVGVALLVRGLQADRPRSARSFGIFAAKAAVRFLLVAVAAAFAVRFALPHAFAGPSPFSFRLDPRYIEDIKRLADLGRSAASFPPAFQWADRTILFPIRNLVLWGAGPFFGLAGLAGLLWALLASRRAERRPLLPLALYALFLIVYHGTSLAKSVRYFYPAYPVLAVLAGLGLAALARRRPDRPAAAAAARALGAFLLAGTFLWSLAFTSIYRRPHTRVVATRWIYENIPPPAPIANEAWDDGLPLPQPGYDAAVYAGPTLHLFDPDSRDKVEMIVKALTEAKWIAVTSNRVYANLTRLPDVFPMSSAYYRALFDGRFGFENIAQFSSYPSFGPLRFPDDRAEEQFTVYDHPRVLLFRKTPAFSEERTRQILLASMPKPPPTLGEWEMKPARERRVVSPLVPRRKAGPLRLAAKAMPGWTPGSFAAALVWYFVLALVGLVALPVCHALFPRFADRGYGFARVLGLLLLTYVYSLAVRTEVVRNGGATAWAIFALFALAAAVALWRKRHSVTTFLRENRRALLAGEAVFLIGFALFLCIRAFNPEIAWGEKPMDFSILNILVRTRSLPPSDPWFAGAPLSYYFFGHQMISFLTLMTGLSTRYTFNLAFGFLGGATLQGAFSVARNWAGTSRAGAAAAAFTLLIGNLSGLRLWLTPAGGPGSGAARAHDWHYFWATSRVIPDTINEYPFWSLLFADLHAHVLAMPLFLLFVACALRFVRDHAETLSWRQRLTAAVLLGFAAALQVLTNAWDVPLLSGLLLVVTLVSAWGGGRVSTGSLARAAIGLAVAAAAALLAAAPLWVRAGGVPGIGWNQEIVREPDLLTVFGFFFLLALAWWASRFSAELSDRGTSRPVRAAVIALLGVFLLALALRSASAFCAVAVLLFLVAAARAKAPPGERLAAGFVASAFFLVLFALHAYIYDRMNTFFKLYFAAWLLFSVATAVLVFGTGRGSLPRRAIATRVLLVLLLAATLFTSVTAARGALFMPGNPSRRGPSTGPTLDGLAYMERFRPGEFYAAEWLRRQVAGTPVLLEAQGPSYQDFGRISMLTGLPTVLGWDYHVKQRGNPESEIEARREAVAQIYSSPEAAAAERLLRKYHVGYVYAGWLERETYPPAGLKKFETAKDLFELAYENREARIYRVIGGDTEDVVMPAREFLPAPDAVAGPQEEPEEPPSLSETATPEMTPYAGMREPRDADVDARGRLWIADFGNNRIRVFDREGGFLGGWGGRGAGTYGLREPGAVAIREEDLYIADTWNGRIQGFGLDGTWKAKADGLYGPRGVAVSPDGRVWATDTGNHRIVVYRPDLTEPKIIGKSGSAPGEFQGPVGIAVSPDGQVFVADTGNKRIQIFEPDGGFRAAWKFPGWASPGEPHLAIDSNGEVYATDPEAGKLVVLDPAGHVVRTLTANQAGEKFSKPTGLALDRKARILYVINSGNNTVTKLELPEARP